MTTEFYIKSLIKEFQPRSQKINLFEPNVNDTAKRVFKFKFSDGSNFKVYVFNKQIELKIKLSTSLHFSINNPDNICLANQELLIDDFPYKLFVRSDESYKEIVLSIKLFKEQIQKLNLEHDEGLYVFRNSINLVVNTNRQLIPELKFLSDLKSHLEINFPEEDDTIDVSNIPEDLKVLVPLLNDWAISDDSEREEKIKKTSKKVLQKIVGTVTPKMKQINSYLDSFGDNPLSNEAISIGNLAEIVSELIIVK